MVERFNRSLLRSYVNDHAEWERYLPLVLFAYRTAVHASTGMTPFEMMLILDVHHSNHLFLHPLLMMLSHISIIYVPNWHN